LRHPTTRSDSSEAVGGRPLIVGESHTALSDLFSKYAILFNQIFNDLLLTLIDPAADG
jgi:hypothetical protein